MPLDGWKAQFGKLHGKLGLDPQTVDDYVDLGEVLDDDTR